LLVPFPVKEDKLSLSFTYGNTLLVPFPVKEDKLSLSFTFGNTLLVPGKYKEKQLMFIQLIEGNSKQHCIIYISDLLYI
jgi:hypothetical protein